MVARMPRLLLYSALLALMAVVATYVVMAPPCAFGQAACPVASDATFTNNIGLQGNTAFTTTFSAAPTADRTLTFPDSTDTMVGRATTDTLTNKTFDANGTGNSLSNVDVADLANGTATSGQVLTSNGAGVAPAFQTAPTPCTSRIVVVKSAIETVNNSATLQNDDELLFAVGANETWVFNLYLLSTSGSTPAFRFAWTVPTSTVLNGSTFGSINGQLTQLRFDAGSVRTMTVASPEALWHFKGVVQSGGTTGNVQFQWAQQTADASDSQVNEGSTLIACQVT